MQKHNQCVLQDIQTCAWTSARVVVVPLNTQTWDPPCPLSLPGKGACLKVYVILDTQSCAKVLFWSLFSMIYCSRQSYFQKTQRQMSSQPLFKLNLHISSEYSIDEIVLPLVASAALFLEPRHCIFQITTQQCPITPSNFSGQKPWMHSQLFSVSHKPHAECLAKSVDFCFYNDRFHPSSATACTGCYHSFLAGFLLQS